MTSKQRFLRTRIAQLNKRNQIIDNAESFVQQAKRFGLTENRWDRFLVNISEEALTYEKFQAIIDQTANSAFYYFSPQSLSARAIKKGLGAKSGGNTLVSNPPGNGTGVQDVEMFDLIVTLNGSFLIRN